jgi:Zn-dependent protease with chaperone function
MRAIFYDGQKAGATTVDVRLHSRGVLEMRAESRQQFWQLSQLQIGARVGDCAAAIDLPDGGRLEIEDAEVFYARYRQIGGAGKSWLHRLEQHWVLVAACLLATVGLVASFVVYGIPFAASLAAAAVPDSVDQAIGRDGADLLDQRLFEPSGLSEERQAELRRVFADVVEIVGAGKDYELRFRQSKAFGANAIALPAGIIILTDELVALAENDDEIAAVLAHEAGHVINRHALRSLIQNSLSAGLIVAVTGDVGSAANLAAGLPALLLNAAYSRDFEREADRVAFEYLRRKDLDPRRLGELLSRIDQKYGRDEGPSLLSTHPGSRERLDAAIAQRDAPP